MKGKSKAEQVALEQKFADETEKEGKIAEAEAEKKSRW